DHLLERCTSGDVHATRGVRYSGALEQARNLTELTTYLLNHSLRSATNCRHGLRTHEERHHTADEEANHHHRIHEVQADLVKPHCRGVGGEQRQRRKGRRTDRETLAYRCSRIAECVQSVRDLADLRAQMAHFRDT